MKVTCKYKNIADEIKKRDKSIEVSVDCSIEAMINVDTGNQHAFDLCYSVLLALGYAKLPKMKPIFDSDFTKQPEPFVKVH